MQTAAQVKINGITYSPEYMTTNIHGRGDVYMMFKISTKSGRVLKANRPGLRNAAGKWELGAWA